MEGWVLTKKTVDIFMSSTVLRVPYISNCLLPGDGSCFYRLNSSLLLKVFLFQAPRTRLCIGGKRQKTEKYLRPAKRAERYPGQGKPEYRLDCEQPRARGSSGEAARRERRGRQPEKEKESLSFVLSLPSRAFSHARGNLRVSCDLLDGPRKKRDCSQFRYRSASDLTPFLPFSPTVEPGPRLFVLDFAAVQSHVTLIA